MENPYHKASTNKMPNPDTVERPIWTYTAWLDNIVEELWDNRDYELAEEYARRMLQGDQFPPIEVHHDTIRDGHHRLYAMRKIGLRYVKVIEYKHLQHGGTSSSEPSKECDT